MRGCVREESLLQRFQAHSCCHKISLALHAQHCWRTRAARVVGLPWGRWTRVGGGEEILSRHFHAHRCCHKISFGAAPSRCPARTHRPDTCRSRSQSAGLPIQSFSFRSVGWVKARMRTGNSISSALPHGCKFASRPQRVYLTW